MSSSHILLDDPSDFPSMPSMPTLRAGGDANALGRIDHYDLLRKLGGGGFGVVYLALDTASGVEVALKTLHPLLKSNAEEMDVLREKFRLVSRLSHPNIAGALVLHPVRDVNIWDETARKEMRLFPGDSVMVMRYAPGTTLSKWRRQFPEGIVPLDQALDIARQIASALDYAHGERIVHRDIKPANIMVETLTTDGGEPPNPRHRVRILDFGLAAEIRSSMSRVSTEQGDTSGTRPYMAPEQWLGKKQDGRTDQYALACVLYELLSGAPPFAGVFETGDPAIMMAAVKGETPEEVEDIPDHVNVAVLRALSKAPKERFTSCTTLVEAIVDGASSPSEPPSPRRRSPAEVAEFAEGGASCPSEPQAVSEAEILRRRFLLNRAVKAIVPADREDSEFKPFVEEAELELSVAEDACKFGRFGAAGESLSKVQKALDGLATAKAERKAQEEAAQRAQEEAAQRAREEAERKERNLRFRLPRLVNVVESGDVERASQSLMTSPKVSPGCAGDRKVVRVGSQEIALRWCPPGTFTMGSPIGGAGDTQHSVTLSKGFWMGETEVTQELWKEVMGDNPAFNQKGESYPVENVSWNDCKSFLESLNARSDVRTSGLRFAMPTEAQWEYACRAGSTGVYGGTGRLDDMGWHLGNSGGATHPVGQKTPNAWGLHDMHGNVWEWCADWYGAYPSGDVRDPKGPSSGSNRIYRGGSWINMTHLCHSANRVGDGPGFRAWDVGFRLLAFQDGK